MTNSVLSLGAHGWLSFILQKGAATQHHQRHRTFFTGKKWWKSEFASKIAWVFDASFRSADGRTSVCDLVLISQIRLEIRIGVYKEYLSEFSLRRTHEYSRYMAVSTKKQISRDTIGVDLEFLKTM